MKRRSLSQLGLLLALLGSGCGEAPLTEGLEQPLSVRGAQFVPGDLPGLPPLTQEQRDAGEVPVDPRPTSASTELTFLRPSLPGVSFSGLATTNVVSISVRFEGLGDGYWVFPAGAMDPTVQNARSFRFVADFHDTLPPGRHRLLFAARDASGNSGTQLATNVCINSPIPDNGNACDPTKQPPALVVSLAWDRPADLDLVLVTPGGEILDSQNPSVPASAPRRPNGSVDRDVAGVAVLDVDSNKDCVIDGRQRENAVFQHSATPGVYQVYARLDDTCGEDSVRYRVSLHSRVLTDAAAGTFSVIETAATNGTVLPLHAGSRTPGTFVTEFVVD